MPLAIEVRLSLDGNKWETVRELKASGWVARLKAAASYVPPVPLPEPPTSAGLLRYAFLCERATWRRIPAGDHLSPLQVERPALPGGPPYWSRIARLDPLLRVLTQMEEMIERLAAKGVQTGGERSQLADLRRRHAALTAAAAPRRPPRNRSTWMPAWPSGG
jgi:hypothetical protein